jgi:hypothetical protein
MSKQESSKGERRTILVRDVRRLRVHKLGSKNLTARKLDWVRQRTDAAILLRSNWCGYQQRRST